MPYDAAAGIGRHDSQCVRGGIECGELVVELETLHAGVSRHADQHVDRAVAVLVVEQDRCAMTMRGVDVDEAAGCAEAPRSTGSGERGPPARWTSPNVRTR